MMIIDGHVHISDEADPVWGTARFTGDDMVALMDEPLTCLGEANRVDKAVVMPTIGVTAMHEMTFAEQHAEVVRAVEKHPDRLVGNFVLNPRLGLEEGIGELRRLVESGRFRMVKMHPTLHNYWPRAKELSYPILEEAASLDIPVLIHTGEPPYSVPALFDPIARDHPNTTIILAHFGTQKICYADDAVNVARHNDNVLLETGWAPLPRLIEGAKQLGPSRLVFGSDSPPLEIYSQIRVVECLHRPPPLGVGMSEDDVLSILGGNLAQLLKLDA